MEPIETLVTVDDAERLAEGVLSPEAWAYIAGGAGDERTLRWNREAFSEFRLRPRVLVDVSSVSTETTVLGTPVSMPVLVAPAAFQGIAHEEGEVATARGTAGAGTLMCLSTVATATPADVAGAAPDAPRWLQIYVFRDRGVTDEVITQALESGLTQRQVAGNVLVSLSSSGQGSPNYWLNPKNGVNYRVVVQYDSARSVFTARAPELHHISGEGATRSEAGRLCRRR